MAMLYEKYRPRTLDQVVGQGKAVKQIKTLLRRGWGGRAWWFAGSSGTGKTTLARIIARMGADDFFVEEYDSGDSLKTPDLQRIERTMYLGATGKRGRVFIINEAHGLPRAATASAAILHLNIEGPTRA